MNTRWKDSYREIKEKHDEARVTLRDACAEDVDENLEVALEKYIVGLAAMNAALSVIVSRPHRVDDTWMRAIRMIAHIKTAKPAIEQRIETLTRCLEEKNLKEGNPTIYSALVKALKEVEGPDVTRELVFCCEEVKFYNINRDGTVTMALDNTLLEVWKYTDSSLVSGTFFIQIKKTAEPVLQGVFADAIDEEDTDTNNPNTCLSEKEWSSAEILWTYPLIPHVSPCFRTRFGAVIFPDLRAPPSEGATIGIHLEMPPDEVLMGILDEVLKCVYRQSGEVPRNRFEEMSQKMTQGAYYLSQGLVYGSHRTGSFITYGTPYLMSRIPKGLDVPVSCTMQTSMEVASSVTGTAASVTGFMAQKLGSATMALGRFIAPHLQKQGSRLLSQGLGMSERDASEKMAGALTVAAGAVEAFGTVYTGLEESATILGRSLSSNSVKVIEHKYGPSAGNLASTTFETAGNVFALSQNVKLMTPKGLAKKTAKSAGKALVEDFKPGPSN